MAQYPRRRLRGIRRVRRLRLRNRRISKKRLLTTNQFPRSKSLASAIVTTKLHLRLNPQSYQGSIEPLIHYSYLVFQPKTFLIQLVRRTVHYPSAVTNSLTESNSITDIYNLTDVPTNIEMQQSDLKHTIEKYKFVHFGNCSISWVPIDGPMQRKLQSNLSTIAVTSRPKFQVTTPALSPVPGARLQQGRLKMYKMSMTTGLRNHVANYLFEDVVHSPFSKVFFPDRFNRVGFRPTMLATGNYANLTDAQNIESMRDLYDGPRTRWRWLPTSADVSHNTDESYSLGGVRWIKPPSLTDHLDSSLVAQWTNWRLVITLTLHFKDLREATTVLS